MADTVQSNQQELSETPREVQSSAYSHIAANAWSGPSNSELGTSTSLPAEFPNLSIEEAEKIARGGIPSARQSGQDYSFRRTITLGEIAPGQGNHEGPNVIKGETGPDKPDDGNDVSTLPRKGNHKGPNAVNSQTAADTPDKESFEGLVPPKRNSKEGDKDEGEGQGSKLERDLKANDHLFEDLMNRLTRPLKLNIQRTQPSSQIQLKKY